MFALGGGVSIGPWLLFLSLNLPRALPPLPEKGGAVNTYVPNRFANSFNWLGLIGLSSTISASL